MRWLLVLLAACNSDHRHGPPPNDQPNHSWDKPAPTKVSRDSWSGLSYHVGVDGAAKGSKLHVDDFVSAPSDNGEFVFDFAPVVAELPVAQIATYVFEPKRFALEGADGKQQDLEGPGDTKVELVHLIERAIDDKVPISFGAADVTPTQHTLYVALRAFEKHPVLGPAKVLRDIDWFAGYDLVPEQKTGKMCGGYRIDNDPSEKFEIVRHDWKLFVLDRKTGTEVASSVIAAETKCPDIAMVKDGAIAAFPEDTKVASWIKTIQRKK